MHLVYSFHPPCLNQQTTIMAVEFDGGVVLGADSRTSTGASMCPYVHTHAMPCQARVTWQPNPLA